MTILQRRRANRHIVVWAARYRNHDERTWHDCTIIDVGEGGAGLILPPDIPVLAGTLVLELRPDAHYRGRPAYISGRVRNGYMLPDGGHRIGIEFIRVSRGRRRTLHRWLERAREVESP